MDFSYVHIRYFIGYVYHICLQDTIQPTLSLCLRCQAMLLPMPLRPLLLTTRSGFMVAEGINVPQRTGVLLFMGPRGRRLRGVFFALRRRPPLGNSPFLLLFGDSPPRCRFLGVGVFGVFFPPQ